MGSGSSKEEKKPDPGRETKKIEPVANVNNSGIPAKNKVSKVSQSQPPQTVQKTFVTQPDDSTYEEGNDINEQKNQTRPDDDARGRPSDGREWQVDETEDELNEVLQVPMANDRQTNRSVHTVSPARQQDLPETYAQRKQREQYKLNQQVLLRQKTIYRNPEDWMNEEEEDWSGKSGFDISKFRSANKSQPGKSTAFTTHAKQDGGVQHTSGQQNMADFDVTPHQQNPPRELPVYNQSEQDLMASLEQEIDVKAFYL